MKKILLGLIFLVLLLVAVAFLAPMLVPASAYKDQLETAAAKAIGRPVTFGDDLSFKIFPQAAFRVSNLEIANPEGYNDPYLAKIGQADIGVRIVPLFNKTVEINQFVLREPDLILVRRADGSVNWNLAAGGQPAAETNTQSATNPLRELSLGDVRIIDGKATYKDLGANQSYDLGAINMVANLDSLEKPLTLDGDFTFQGAPSRANIILTTLGGILRQEEANLKIDVAFADASAGADLSVKTGETLTWRGPVRMNAPDLPAFAKLFDVALEDAPGFDRFSVNGQAIGSASNVRFAGTEISFDAINAQGDLLLDWSGAKPKATGSLSTSSLDLRPYMPPPAETSAGFPAWSEAKMDFTSLRNVDADLDIVADKILMNSLNIDSSRMKLGIANGRMVADIPEISMYGGTGSGRVVVNARSGTPSFSGDFDLGAVQAQPLSLDMLKTDRLLGIGQVNINFTASGTSQAAIMRTLDGSGGFDLADGAIKGLNLVKVARAATTLQSGGINPAAIASLISDASSADEATDYSQFLCKFNIADGLLSIPTITLNGPFLTMTGTGTLNLPNQTIDLRLSPRASTTSDGSGGRSVAVPLRVSGTFGAPKYGIDAESLVRDRVESGVRNIIGGALGGGSDNDAEDAEDGEEESTGEAILKGLFGRDDSGSSQVESETAPDNGQDNGNEPSIEEQAAGRALDLIFGTSSSGEDESSDEEADPQ